MALFESYERRIDKINSVLNSYGIASIEEAEKITTVQAAIDYINGHQAVSEHLHGGRSTAEFIFLSH